MKPGKRWMTGIPEGTCIMTKKSKSGPKFILAYADHALDRDCNLISTKDWQWDDPRWDQFGIQPISFSEALLKKALGLYWIGLPPREVSSWRMAWSEWSHLTDESTKDEKPKEGQKKSHSPMIRTRVEETCFFFMKRFGYAFDMEGVETCEGVKVDIKFTIYVEGYNPKTALVDNDDWFLTFEGLVREQARKYIRGKGLIELLSKDAESPDMVRRFLGFDDFIDKKHAAAPKNPQDGSAIRDDFDDFMFAIQGKKKVDPNNANSKGPQTAPLREALGIRIVDATFEELNVDEEDPIVKEFSLNLRTRIENAAAQERTDTEGRNIERLAESKKKAYQMRTDAKEDRVKRVDLPLLNVQVQLQKMATDAKLSEADAVKKNPNLRTVIFSNSGVTGAGNQLPVALSIGVDKDEWDDGPVPPGTKSAGENPPKEDKGKSS